MRKITTETLGLKWPARNAAIEIAVREMLDPRPSEAEALSTLDVAKAIAEGLSQQEIGKLAGFLTRLAPHLERFATHDGETTTRFNKPQTRWRWWGQKIGGANE